MKKTETDFNCGFGKLVDLTGFQSSILLFVTMMCWRHEAVILSFKGNFSSFIALLSLSCVQAPQWEKKAKNGVK